MLPKFVVDNVVVYGGQCCGCRHCSVNRQYGGVYVYCTVQVDRSEICCTAGQIRFYRWHICFTGRLMCRGGGQNKEIKNS